MADTTHPLDEWIYPAKLISVTDGDTVVLTLSKDYPWSVSLPWKFGFRFSGEVTMQGNHRVELEGAFRLLGINTPEIHGKNKAEVKKGLAAKNALIGMIAQGTLQVQSFKPTEMINADKYGRWLVKIFVTPSDATQPPFEVTAELLRLGHAVPYNGGTKPPFEE